MAWARGRDGSVWEECMPWVRNDARGGGVVASGYRMETGRGNSLTKGVGGQAARDWDWLGNETCWWGNGGKGGSHPQWGFHTIGGNAAGRNMAGFGEIPLARRKARRNGARGGVRE